MTETVLPGPAPRERFAARLSKEEVLFERRRLTVGLFLGPAVFAALLAFPPSGLTPEAGRLAAVVAWVVVWWVTEAVPIPVTALLGPALAILLGTGGAKEMFASFGDPIILLFLGSFVLAEAMSVHGVDRRLAHRLLSLPIAGSSPFAAVATFGLLAAGLSMWLSNSATTAMLYPIALGVGGALDPEGTRSGRSRLATSLLLVCAYGSSIGGIATPVGTPPNLIALAQLSSLAGVKVAFVPWMVLAVPISLVLLVGLFVLMRVLFPPHLAGPSAAGVAEALARIRPGPLSRGEKNVVAAFLVTVALWVGPGVATLLLGERSPVASALAKHLPEGAVAVLGASLLFVLPVSWRERTFTLTWADASRIDWGTLMLFGGGLALGGAMFRTGLAEAVGKALTTATGVTSTAGLTVVFTVFAIYFTEVTSNTATATMLVPLAIASAEAAGASVLEPALGCAIGCSMAFMLPVATPPNAIVYGSGLVRIGQMVKTGFWMNAVASVVVSLGVLLLVPLVLR